MEVHRDEGGLAAFHEFVVSRMDDLTERIADDARANAHVDTGELRADITAEIGGPWIVRSEADDVSFYAELGTSKMDAIPYLRPAVFQEREL